MGGDLSSIPWKDQYKHPLWQKKRLEVLEAAEFCCQSCYSKEDQLHVHHKRYVKGRMIWEYENSELECLCDGCHETAHEERSDLNHLLSLLPAESIADITALIAGYCANIAGPCGLVFSKNEFEIYREKSPFSLAAGVVGAISHEAAVKTFSFLRRNDEAPF